MTTSIIQEGKHAIPTVCDVYYVIQTPIHQVSDVNSWGISKKFFEEMVANFFEERTKSLVDGLREFIAVRNGMKIKGGSQINPFHVIQQTSEN